MAQILSPAFPVGGFAWSQGLEWAMDQGAVTRATLSQWLADWMDHGAGWTDAVLAALSLRGLAFATAALAIVALVQAGALTTLLVSDGAGVRYGTASGPQAGGLSVSHPDALARAVSYLKLRNAEIDDPYSLPL